MKCWDNPILPAKTNIAKIPDLTFINTDNKSTYLTDVAIPSCGNIQEKNNEKIEKYSDLAIESNIKWSDEQLIVFPFVMSAMEIPNKSFQAIQ